MTTQPLTRQTQQRIYPVFAFAAVGFVLGGLLFGLFGRPTIVIETRDHLVEIASTTKVDNLDAANEVLARGHVRLTSATGPTLTGGIGVPAFVAPIGSTYQSLTTGSTWVNTDGTGAGWTEQFRTGNFPTSSCGGAGEAMISIGNGGLGICGQFFSVAGDHLSSSGATVSLAQIATASFLGRTTAGTGNVETLTATQATALLSTVTILAKGLVPTLPNDATKYLDGTGSYSVPAGTGVSSITAGQSITVTGTTTPTVALNFPTTACGAGTAVTSSNSAGTPNCSTFFNTAGDHLSNTGSTVQLAQVATASFLGRTTAGTGNVETLTATQATALLNTFTSVLKGLVPASGGGTSLYLRADGTWAAPTSSTAPNNELLDGIDATCTFNGSSTPVCGATLSGSVYTMTRDIFSTTISISNGVEVKEMGYGIFNTGNIATNTSGKITDNGADASGSTQGAARAGGGRYGANAAGGAPGSSPGASGQAPGPWIGTLAATSTPTIAVGVNGGLCQGASGGSGSNGDPSTGGGAITIVNVGNSHAVSNSELTDGLTRLGNNSLTTGSGGSGGGNSGLGGNRGGGGASGGFVMVQTDSFTGTGTLEAKGGRGGDATGNTGGGGGGGGGIVFVRYRTNGGVTFDVSGGSFGNGAGAGFRGGTGGTCKVIKQNLSGDGT